MRGITALVAVMVLGVCGSARGADLSCHSFSGGSTLDVGDSHTVLPGCEAQAPWDVDARIGRSSTAALPALDESLAARHEVVVFDIATNDIIDPPTFRSNLRRVWNRIGDRELVLVTTWIVCCPDTPPGPVNRAIENFADLHPRRITVAEWDDVARAHPDFFSQDGIHLTAAGYARRVAFIHRKGQAAGFRAPATGQVEDGP